MTAGTAARHIVLQAFSFFLFLFLINDHINIHYTEFADVCKYFSHRILILKICSVVLLPALNPVASSVIISLAWGLSLFKMTFSMTLLE